MKLMFSLVSGIICGVFGLFLLSYACFATTQSWRHSLSHWCCGIVGVCLLFCFWRHTAFYLGLSSLATYVCENPKTAGKLWDRYSRKLINMLFTVHIHNESTYTQPTIFVMNHIAHSRPFDEFCLALIQQPNLRIVALPRKPGSSPHIILTSSNYLPVKHGQGYDGFMESCSKALKNGDSLLLFPEGKHTEQQLHWTQLSEFQSGAFDLALKTQCPIVPLILEGFNCPNGWIKGFGQGAQPLRLHYLDPIDPKEFIARRSTQSLKDIVRHQMNQKLKRIWMKSLPDDKAKIAQLYL